MVLQILFIKHYPSVLFNIYGGYSFNEVAFNLYFSSQPITITTQVQTHIILGSGALRST